MRRTPYESAAAPMSHSAADPAEFNAVCRSKSNLPNRTDSNAALLPYLTHQLGSAHEWSGVWNGPYSGCLPFVRIIRLGRALINGKGFSKITKPTINNYSLKSR